MRTLAFFLCCAAFAQPVSLKGLADEGTFFLSVDGEKVGEFSYRLSADGAYSRTATVKVNGQSQKSTVEVAVDAKGYWTKIETVDQAGTNVVTRDEMNRATIKSGPRNLTFYVEEDSPLYDSFGPALMGLILRIYDQKRGGNQMFKAWLIPNITAELNVERTGSIDRKIGGQNLKLTRYKYILPGVEIAFLTDEKGKVYYAETPGQKAVYVRKGYEELQPTKSGASTAAASK